MKCNKEDLVYKSDILKMINTEHNSWGSCAVEFEMAGLKSRIRRLEPISEQDIYEKAYRDGQDKGYSCGYSDGYNKAIDEFVVKIKEYCSLSRLNAEINTKIFEQIAEQMKEGGKNE